MRFTTMLALAALCVAGCRESDYGGVGTPSCFMDTCSGPGYYGPLTMTSMIGFPSSRVDTVGPLPPGGNYYGRLQVGDSVALYLVKHDVRDDPCASRDTLRAVTWSTADSVVLQARPDSNGRGVVRAVANGESMIVAAAPVTGATTNLWSCQGARSSHYIGRIRVDPKTP